ncbi:cell division protein FtsQ/DivIB [Gleimia coleocanis]|uniref:cell division protein FtsQ/DivIB n=1 Tax=Gleimia coleocanis TaxID=103618 RepID=UPI001300CD92|nr:FtsQ-type POTRA domain-containing protein [Gleimia coleocanis]
MTLVEELKLSQPVGSKPSVASKLRGYVAAATAASTFKSKNHQSSELEERRLEVRRAKLRSYSWLGISVVAGLLVVGGLVWAVFFSTLFALNAQQITVVKGSEKVSPAQVQTILRKWDGVPLPRVSTGNMEAELASIPLVKSAEVSRSWPNGLEISLDLRVPVFSVEEAGQWQIYDTEGVQIETSPVIAEGTLRAELTATDPQKRVQALQLMAQVRSQLDVELLEEVAVLRSEGSLLEIVLNSGAVVKWGDASDTPFKLKVLKVLLGQVPAKLYDVSVPAKPVTA